MANGLLALYYSAFALLAFFSLHRLWLLLLLRRRTVRSPDTNLPASLPRVTIQLPIFNERYVAGRLLEAVNELDYPRDLLDIQVLDDSTDETRGFIARRVAQLGAPFIHITRSARDGYKAGALAHGMRSARGEFILILDADFVPQPSLLRELLPAFADTRIAMVQARWGHINRDANALTRAQGLLLDAHFLLETEARARGGLFWNFHGTAGLWRRAAIEQCGGWSADTLTEDLDLSYRAQLAGWRFVYRPGVVVPAELPATLPAFRQQQARWAQGTVATARKLCGRIWRADLPLRVRLEATLHLTCHSIYPATLVVALTALPAMLLRPAMLGYLDLLFALCVIVPTRIFYRRAARVAGTKPPGLRQMPYLMLTGIALSVSNTRAVANGLFDSVSVFNRTPKKGYSVRTSSLMRSLDGSVAAYLVLATGIAAGQGMVGAVPAFLFLAWAFGAAAVKG